MIRLNVPVYSIVQSSDVLLSGHDDGYREAFWVLYGDSEPSWRSIVLEISAECHLSIIRQRDVEGIVNL